jgi:hypothetical protein
MSEANRERLRKTVDAFQRERQSTSALPHAKVA